MDSSTAVVAVISALMGALALLLVYMASRAGAYDGVQDAERDKARGDK